MARIGRARPAMVSRLNREDHAEANLGQFRMRRFEHHFPHAPVPLAEKCHGSRTRRDFDHQRYLSHLAVGHVDRFAELHLEYCGLDLRYFEFHLLPLWSANVKFQLAACTVGSRDRAKRQHAVAVIPALSTDDDNVPLDLRRESAASRWDETGYWCRAELSGESPLVTSQV